MASHFVLHKFFSFKVHLFPNFFIHVRSLVIHEHEYIHKQNFGRGVGFKTLYLGGLKADSSAT